jgi:hypothetical protein
LLESTRQQLIMVSLMQALYEGVIENSRASPTAFVHACDSRLLYRFSFWLGRLFVRNCLRSISLIYPNIINMCYQETSMIETERKRSDCGHTSTVAKKSWCNLLRKISWIEKDRMLLQISIIIVLIIISIFIYLDSIFISFYFILLKIIMIIYYH